jgi:hypothetical protein
VLVFAVGHFEECLLVYPHRHVNVTALLVAVITISSGHFDVAGECLPERDFDTGSVAIALREIEGEDMVAAVGLAGLGAVGGAAESELLDRRVLDDGGQKINESGHGLWASEG